MIGLALRVAAPAALALLGSAAHGQAVLLELHGEDHYQDYGRYVAAAGDVDGDGSPDFMHTWYERQDCGDVGRVDVRSSVDGALLLRLYGETLSFGMGLATAGDLDGDGLDDVIVGEPGALAAIESGRVRVYSGVDGSVLREVEGVAGEKSFGRSLAGGIDLDADGVPDFVIGIAAFGASGGLGNHGAVRACSGADGAVLWQWVGDSSDRAGEELDVVGDLDGDGAPELVVSGSGVLRVLNGADGSVRYELEGIGDLGHSVAALGDWNGDGVPDFAAAAPFWGSGRVRIYSGASGALVKQVVAPEDEAIGWWVIGIGDIDGNGRSDLMTGRIIGPAFLYGGPDGALIGRTPAAPLLGSPRGGTSLPDLDGDGVPEILLGMAGSGGGVATGALRIHSDMRDCDGNGRLDWLDLLEGQADCDGDGVLDACEGLADCWPCGGENYCEGSHSSSGYEVATRSSGSFSLSAERLVLSARLAPPNQAGIFFFGTAPQEVPFADGFHCVAPPHQRFPLSPTDACGFAAHSVDMTSPPGALLQVGTWYFQYWFRDGSSSNFGRGYALTLCP